MTLPTDFSSRILFGFQFETSVVAPSRYAHRFFEVFADPEGAPDAMLQQVGEGLAARMVWSSGDQLVSADYDYSAMRLQVRSPIPEALISELGEDAPESLTSISRSYGDMKQAAADFLSRNLLKALASVGSPKINRVGVVLELELPLESVVAMTGDALGKLGGAPASDVTEASYRIRTDLPEHGTTTRRMIVTYQSQRLRDAQLHRFEGESFRNVTTLSLDYQEVFSGALAVAKKKEKLGLTVPFCLGILERAEEAWNDVYDE